ncbi:serine/threonine-protein phosphatase [Azoarcus indigens]|uniref:Protein phosphatase n=1 Tax=Azoarcus indigens TaxID=29545 RepID=A0A4R6E741_9RHOO|nr:protein phosphatase 2C domain-containing protein [Azoarcus indigens]NMG63958.1 serine/threonine-protein phosphatase [Azoarcus indigens]TDN53766.1 protein phosphatase [Azoarcus indigens]
MAVVETQGGAPLLRCACRTDVGRVRARNEDAYRTVPDRGWLVLADGMGGYRGGDVAAAMAVDAVVSRLEAEQAVLKDAAALTQVLRSAVAEANAEIHDVGLRRVEVAGMGSTIVIATFLPGVMVCAHVGDSRLYRFRDGVLTLLTRDHTLLQEQVDAGMIHPDEARRSRFRGMLTRGLGIERMVELDVAEHETQWGDCYLLCSDGLTDMLMDDEIEAEIGVGGSLDDIAGRLVDLANMRGGRDNVTVILAQSAGSR